MPNVSTNAELDRAVIVVDATEIMMPYASAFSIAQHLRLAAKRAMQMAREDVSKWRGYASFEEIIPTPHSLPRRTLAGKFDWSITLKDWDERVFLRFGNYDLTLHFEKALELAFSLRHAAKIAKAWAGDQGKGFYAAGSLTDAEKNYKYGWN